jgi:hypothetical protein
MHATRTIGGTTISFCDKYKTQLLISQVEAVTV